MTKSNWHLEQPSKRAWTAQLILASLAFAFFILFSSAAFAETRKLKLYFLHTGEKAEITFKKNGKYIKGGLNKINRFLRDWRRNEPTKMDPRLLDLIWEIYKETGSKKYIHVVSAYRSPATNNLLRKRGRGVAKKSQHTLGKALDFFIPGVNLRKLRNIGLRKGLGGVGYYPKSGSPFVHMDTGRVRHWPRMTRKELARVFPKGKTLHVPTDGKPLARYNQAKLEYERKIKGSSKITIATAEEIVKKPSVFAKLLGRGEDEEGGVSAASTPRAVATTRPTTRDSETERPKKPEVKKPEKEAAPGPAPKPEIAEPVSPSQLPDRAPQAATPEILIASLPPDLVPVPQLAPRPEPASEEPTTGSEVALQSSGDPASGPVSDVEAELPPATALQSETGKEQPQLAPENNLTPPINTGNPATVIASAAPAPAVPRPAESVGDGLAEAPVPADAPVAGETTELALAVPVPARRPGAIALQPALTDIETPAEIPAQETAVRVAALSPAEIEGLRKQVYSLLSSGKDIQARLPAGSAIGNGNTQLAENVITDIEAEPSNRLSLVPSPNPKREAERIINQQIATLEPIEPGTETSDVPGIPTISPRAVDEEVKVASLAPIEPGVKESGELALPTPNPAALAVAQAAIEPADPPLGLKIPVPQAAQRPILIAAVTNNGAEEAEEIRRLESLSSIEIEERVLGKWALAADASIADIAEIRPPAYARNIIRELPRTVLSRGFARDNRGLSTDRFTGSSIEFLDFTKFN